MQDKNSILANLMGATNNGQQQQKMNLQQQQPMQAPTSSSNQENMDPGARQANNDNMTTNTSSRNSKQAKAPRPRSSAATSVTSGTSLGTMVQSGRGQHKLKSRFSVIRKLGKGTYGKVQLAINKETGQEVAIKTIKKSKIENEQDLERVRREIQIMSSIEHPHIVHIYEVFENKDKIVLVMQYAPGGELYEYVSQSKQLDDNEARRLFRQIATAIYYCHKNKICHRDLKLENILLDEKNNAKLADFGLSNVFDKRRQLSTFCGSPLYASPEIVQGSPYEGPEVDCWSLGVLLYTLVYGAMPFDGSNFKRLVKQISEASYFEPKQKSQASSLIRHLLCADPKHRATIVDICTDPWVNGTIPVSPQTPTNATTINGELISTSATRHSLLQVAQDMVKLAPVRFDILMALLPPELVNAPANNDTMRHGEDNAPVNEPATNYENPVASYVVRDLEPHEPESKTIDQKQSDSSMEVDKSAHTLIESKHDDETIGKVDDKEQQQMVQPMSKPDEQEPMITDQTSDQKLDTSAAQELPMEVATTELAQQQDVPNSVEQEQMVIASEQPGSVIETIPVEVEAKQMPMDDEPQVTTTKGSEDIEASDNDQVMLPTQDGSIETKEPKEQIREKDDSTSKMSTDEDKQIMPTGDQAGNQDQPVEMDKNKPEEPVAMQTDEDIRLRSKRSSEGGEAAPEDTDKLSVPAVSEGSKSPISDSGQAAKPKKKKKIIVVKKVVKKAKQPATSDTNKEQAKEETTTKSPEDKDQEAAVSLTEVKDETTTRSLEAESTEAPSDTNKSNDSGQVVQRKQSTVSNGNASLRRRSTLVTELSDKLLQQLASDAANGASSPSAILKMEQAALFGQVNVSEKKEDFERRASLLLTEPEIEHCRRPSFDKRDSIIEGDMQQPSSDMARSDSLETLKANATVDEGETTTLVDEASPVIEQMASPTCVTCEWAEPNDAIRSSFEINLKTPSPTKEQPIVMRNSIGQQQQQHESNLSVARPSSAASSGRDSASNAPTSLGPVPITRSYKKVTFTKDGACVTETGKVYSAKDNDGTMRRIERKSKVTHYPANQVEFGPSGGKKVVTTKETTSEVFSSCSGTPVAFSAFNNDPWRMKATGGAGLERLVMPSASIHDDLLDNDDEDDLEDLGLDVDHHDSMFKQRKNNDDQMLGSFSRRDRDAGGVAHSESNASSCSSNSTDAFDDIFDNWTGAISMFERQSHRLRNSFDRKFGRESPAESLFNRQHPFLTGHHTTRRRKVSSSGSASGRCESADQQRQTMSRMQQFNNIDPLAQHQQQFRPASAMEANPFDNRQQRRAGGRHQQMGGLRHGFGGSRPNLFFDTEPEATREPFDTSDPFEKFFDSSDLMRQINLKHSQLHKQLSQGRQKFWRGSTSSLFDDASQTNHETPMTSTSRRSNATANLPPQPATMTSARIPQAAAPPRPPLPAPRMNPARVVLQETASPLDHKPIRRNTTQSEDQPDQAVQRSTENHQVLQRTTSRSSMISDRLSQVHLSQSQSSSKKQQVASFIELKRTSSSSLGPTKTITSMSTTTATTAAADLNQGEPMIVSSQQKQQQQQRTVVCNQSNEHASNPMNKPSEFSTEQQRAATDATDMRIQSWLQESSSNFSSSSGSKSSASFATMDGSGQPVRADNSFGNLYHQQPASNATAMYRSTMQQQQQQQHHQQPTQGHHQSSSSTTISSATNRLINMELPTGAPVEKKQIIKTISTASVNKASSSTTTTKTMTTNFSTSMQMRGNSMLMPGQVKGTTAATATTMTTTTSSMMDDFFSNDDPFGDHQSQSTNSSKSILDQLRSRGLRSVLNQRLASTATTCGGGATDSGLAMTEQAVTSSPISSHSSAGLQETASSSIISQKHHNLIEESVHWSKQDESESDIPKNHPQTPADTKLTVNNNNKQSAENTDETARNTTGDTNGSDDKQHQVNNVGVEQQADDIEIANDDDDDDDCLKQARANIKAYRDRMKETDLFLKSVTVADEEAQRQRQELFMFNDLMIRNKLNGLSRYAVTPPDTTFDSTPNGYRSAPVQNSWLGGQSQKNPLSYMMVGDDSIGHDSTNLAPFRSQIYSHGADWLNERRKSAYLGENIAQHNNLESTIHLKMPPSQSIYRQHSPIRQHDRSQTPERVPVRAQSLAPDLNKFNSQTTTNGLAEDNFSPFAKSTFQPIGLDYTRSSRLPQRRSRPLSIDLSDPMYTPISSTSMGRNRRSSSVARHSTLDYESRKAPVSASVYMSEYQRAYGGNKQNSSSDLGGDRSSSKVSNRYFSKLQTDKASTIQADDIGNSKISQPQEDDDELIEKSMSCYRPSSYTPKVVPQGLPTRRSGRSYERRSLTSELKPQSSSISSYDKESFPSRRISIQPSTKLSTSPSRTDDDEKPAEKNDLTDKSDKDSQLDTRPRRASMYSMGHDSGVDSTSDRLSELESRLEANKRRRQELLNDSKLNSPPTRSSGSVSNIYGRLQHKDNDLGDGEMPIRGRSATREPSPIVKRITSSDLDSPSSSQKTSKFTTSGRLVPRSSRLESMEARIKRRSYCIRVDDNNN